MFALFIPKDGWASRNANRARTPLLAQGRSDPLTPYRRACFRVRIVHVEPRQRAMNMLVKTVTVERNMVSVVRLADRRTASHTIQEWCYQKVLEAVLFANGFGRSTGAMNKLLARSAAGTAPNLLLKRSSIDAGLVTKEEFQWLVDHLHDSVRSFTLVPLTSLEAALDAIGANPRAKALADALGLARPGAPTWSRDLPREIKREILGN